MLGDKEIFVKNFNRLLFERGMTLNQFAVTSGISYSTARAWAIGTNYPQIDKIQQIADFFGVTKAALTDAQIYDGHELDPDTLELAKEIESRPVLRRFVMLTKSFDDDALNFSLAVMKALQGKPKKDPKESTDSEE